MTEIDYAAMDDRELKRYVLTHRNDQQNIETGFLSQRLRVSHLDFRKKPGFLAGASLSGPINHRSNYHLASLKSKVTDS